MSAQRQRVLLIVDDLGVVWPARHALEAAGYEVRWYGDAKAALNALDTFAPEVVIVDVMLPGGGGWTVVDTIRALPQEERPKLLVISEAVGFEQTTRIDGMDVLFRSYPAAAHRLWLQMEAMTHESYVRGEDVDCSVLCKDGKILAHTIQTSLLPRRHPFGIDDGLDFIRDPQTLGQARPPLGSTK